MEEKQVLNHLEYILEDNIYEPSKGFGRGIIRIFNSEAAMNNMTIKDIEAIEDNIFNTIKKLKNFLLQYQKNKSGKKSKSDKKILGVGKISTYQSNKIRELYASKIMTLKELGEIYGVSGETIRLIISNKIHIP